MSSRPAIVIVHSTREIQILELTVPSNFKSVLQNARVRKQNKENYNYLVNDLKDRKWNTTYHSVEIGSLGHIPPSAKEAIIDILPHDQIQLSPSILLKAAKVSITCSQHIFMAHKQIPNSVTLGSISLAMPSSLYKLKYLSVFTCVRGLYCLLCLLPIVSEYHMYVFI